MPAADGQRAGHKLSDDGPEGNIPIVNIDGGLSLIHPAAPSARKDFHDQQSHTQPGGGGYQKGSQWREAQAGPEQPEARELN
jgi:hypothetical protein